jgi:anti-sigma-K factor RskA
VAAAAALVVVAGASLWLARDPGQQTVAVELMPTSASSDARAEAVLERDDTGIRVHLHVEGLSRPPDGAHYECWYVSDDDSPTRPDRVSAGTFRVPGPAPATIEMVTAADPATYTRIVVTLERDDGDPAPGEPVLASERWQPREA